MKAEELAESRGAQGGEVTASQMSFRLVAVLPALLLIVFGAIWLYDRSHGGFKPTRLTASEELAQPIPAGALRGGPVAR
jgi:hypothetical protein